MIRDTSRVNMTTDPLMSQKLEQLRIKLLDLSLANRLLNFKHSSQGRSFVRLIHTTPSVLWESLQLQSLPFCALPPLEQNQEQNDSIPRPEKIDLIEPHSKDRLRQVLGLPSQLSSNEALIDHAKQYGIEPSFDLPKEWSVERSLPKQEIQLLLLPKNAEQQLSYVRDAAHQRIEETGINMLFCSFGFLQWYETPESPLPLYAPLLLLPVELKREIQNHQFVYTLSSTDEEPIVNLTLKEKLKQFGVILPEWEEQDSPETYWQRLEKGIHAQKNWQIRRWITVGIFPFSRMAMYEDLDPSHPQLLNHAQTRTLLLGQEAFSSDSICYQKEEKEHLPSPHPLLISQVDSSQYAAIFKALQSPSVVMKGPPGTGKSQTITNLIAASLAKGENVLFVADKQAALQVVFSRLKEAGLADFCLEIHSYQATRSSVIQSLKKRLELSIPKPLDHLEKKLVEVQELHDALDQYIDFMKRSLGHSSFTVKEILWAARKVSDANDMPSIFLKTYFDQVEHITPKHIQKAKTILKGMEKTYDQVIGKEGNLHKHPWQGLTNSILSPFQIEDIHEKFQSLSASIKQLETHCLSFYTHYGISLDSLEKTEQLATPLSHVLTLTDNIQLNVLSQCEDAEWRSKTEQLIQTVKQLQSFSEELQIDFSLLASFPLTILEKLETLSLSLPFKLHSTSQLGQELEHTIRQTKGLEQLQQLSLELAQAFKLEGPLTIEALKQLWSSIHYLACIPPSLLKWRYLPLYEDTAYAKLCKAQQQALHLQQMTQQLEQHFRLEKWDAAVDLMPTIQVLEQKTFWNCLNPSFYRARQFYQDMSLHPCKQPQLMAAELREVKDYLTACLQFEQDSDLHQLCGPHFKGLHTDFASLLEAAQFGREVKRRFANQDSLHPVISLTLLEGQEEDLQRLVAYTKHSMAPALNHFLSTPHDSCVNTLEGLVESWKTYQHKLNEMMICLRDRSLPSSFKLEDLSHWLGKGRAIQQSWSKLEELRLPYLTAGFPLSSPSSFISSLQETLRYWHYVDDQPLLKPLIDHLLKPSIIGLAETEKPFIQHLLQQIERVKIQWQTVKALGGIEETWFFSSSLPFAQQTWQSLLARLENCIQHPHLLNSWMILQTGLATAKQEDLALIYRPFIEENKPFVGLCEAYECVLYRSLARYAYTLDAGLLNRFNGMEQEQALTRVTTLDQEIKQLSKDHLRALLCERLAPSGNGFGKKSAYTELALVKHEVSKQKRHIPIRQLMQRATETMKVLKPCLLMSPLSLAQYLPRDSLTFDLLVIDEASQMRPEEAIGAISRAKRVVIVGDPMQLPPSDFFIKMDDPALEDDEQEEGIEHDSILDLALATFHDTCELRWHYRSQHESLIAFSNRYFYDNRLLVFPSAHHHASSIGIKWVPVQGLYQTGVNHIEAQTVVKAVIEFMQRYPERSLGIVTLNRTQRDVLLEEFEYAIQQSPHAAAYMARWETTLHAPFIKNLENVQGDERDAIFISLVYGPNAEGNVTQHFGPINKQYGHRRLNVLFTRARAQLIVFSSLLPEHIKAEGKNAGVGILKNYLEYASTGRLEVGWDKGQEPESDFESCVANKIREMGCKAIPQVGVAGYRIDIGVQHPHYPYGYLLGIECDGATYHSSQLARKRDRLRQELLEQQGWTIYRIWSTDWFRDPLTQTKKLTKFIEELVIQKNAKLTKNLP